MFLPFLLPISNSIAALEPGGGASHSKYRRRRWLISESYSAKTLLFSRPLFLWHSSLRCIFSSLFTSGGIFSGMGFPSFPAPPAAATAGKESQTFYAKIPLLPQSGAYFHFPPKMCHSLASKRSNAPKNVPVFIRSRNLFRCSAIL